MGALRSPWLFVSSFLAFNAASACGGADDVQRHASDDVPGDTGQGQEVSASGPSLTLVAPLADTVVRAGDAVALTVLVAEAGADLSTLSVTWTSDRQSGTVARVDTDAGGRATTSVTALAPGRHTLTATVSDPQLRTASATVHITVDGAPSGLVVDITPAAPTTLDDLAAVVTTPAVDPDGDALTLRYQWTVDGVDAHLATATAPAARTAKGERWKVIVIASDPAGQTTSASAEVVIANSAPTCSQAIVLPSAGDTTTDIRCSCSDRDDADPNDTEADNCTFLAGGVALGTPGSCTLPASETTRGQAITCELTPGDGTDAGAPMTTSAFNVLDAPPSAPVAALAPESADATTELTCTIVTPGVDPDEADASFVSHLIAWQVNGATDTTKSTVTVVAGLLVGADGKTAHKGDKVTCSATATDGSASSRDGVSNAVTLANAVPEVGTVLVGVQGGGEAVAGATLTCNANHITDRDGDAITVTASWYVNDTLVVGQSGQTLEGDYFKKGDVVRCELAAGDGTATSDRVASKTARTIKNSLPSVDSATLSPTSATRSGTLTCSYAGWGDVDGDLPEVSYSWFLVGAGGAEASIEASGATLAASTVVAGSTVRCAVTPMNGLEAGTSVASNDATISNTAPTLGGATLGPVDPLADATLTCTATGYADVDDDAPSYTYSWTKNTQPIAGASGATLAGSFAKGDHLRCKVVASDGLASATEQTSNEVIIGNSTPALAGVTLTPTAGTTCSTFTCTPGALTDADSADATSATYRWEVNGQTLAGTAAATLSGRTFAPGDSVKCFATPYDGMVYGTEQSSGAVTVDNAAPSIANVEITPATVGVGHTLTCKSAGWTDDCTLNADATYTYAWHVNTALEAGETASTLVTNDADYAVGDAIRCQATPHDALTAGHAVSSSTVTLGQGDPTAAVVTVKAPNQAQGDVTCAITTEPKWFVNPTYTYHWSINGGPETARPATLTAAEVADCDRVTCRVVVSDANATLGSNTAELQLAVGDDCEDGNDCTSHVCSAGGGCAAPVAETGLPCMPADLCKPAGVCAAGECASTGNTCVEEALSTTTPTWRPAPTAFGSGGYAVETNGTWVRGTDANDSRANEWTTVNVPAGTLGTRTMDAHPIATADGNLFALAMNNCTYGGHPNNYDSCAIVAQRIAPDGTVTTSPAGGIIGNNGCGSIVPPKGHALELAGNRVAIVSSSYRYYTSTYGCTAANSGISLLPVDGLGSATVLVPGTDFPTATSSYSVVNAAFDAAATPAGSSTFALVWVSQPATTLYVRRSTWSAGVLTSGTKITVATATTTISTPHVASFSDGSFLVGWSDNGDAWFQPFDSDGVKVGAAIRANDVQSGTQTLGGLATFSDFGFVAIWEDGRSDGNGNQGIRAQLFDAAAVPESAAFNLNAYSAGQQGFSAVAALEDDQWVATWYDPTLVQIMTRRFERDGTTTPGIREMPPTQTTAGDQSRPRAASSKQGTTLLVWDTPLYTNKSTEIGGRLLGRSVLGEPRALTEELQLNTLIDSTQKNAVVAGGDDRFVVAWESLSEDGNAYGIVARIFDAQAAPVTDAFIVNTVRTGNQQKPAVAIRNNPQGGQLIVIAWHGPVGTDTGEIRAKVYDANGVELVAETLVNATSTSSQQAPAVAPWGAGFLFGWESSASGDNDLFMRPATVNGAAFAFGVEAQINATMTGDQKNLALAVAPTGYAAACWETPDASAGLDIKCSTFKPTTLATQVAEFSPATTVAGTQQSVALAHDSSGRLVAVWESDGIDVGGKAILARAFSALGVVTGPRVMANRFQAGDQTRPFVAPLPGLDVWLGWQSAAQDGDGASVVVRLLGGDLPGLP